MEFENIVLQRTVLRDVYNPAVDIASTHIFGQNPGRLVIPQCYFALAEPAERVRGSLPKTDTKRLIRVFSPTAMQQQDVKERPLLLDCLKFGQQQQSLFLVLTTNRCIVEFYG